MSVLPLPALISALSTRDLTDPANGPHTVALLVDAAIDGLTRLWGCPSRVLRSRPVVTIADNYDRLGYTAEAVSRDARYTRYVSDTCVLRGHTTAGVPPALRRIAAEADPPQEVLLALPGICHRRDSIDRLHTGTPHQLDLWLLRRGGRRLDHHDLTDMVTALTAAVLPGRHWRWTERVHPYTTGGRQVDVVDGGDLVELAECGVAAPAVLDEAGLDSRSWSALALGMGLDRAVMLRKNIPDIRLLRSDDPRVAAQMRDLSPYEPVSSMPPARRDVSVAVSEGAADAETLGDRIRDGLGTDAELIEQVEVLSATPYDGLPVAARQRLGITAGQVNVLARIVLRPLDRTLTGDEINTLRERIHAAIHEGSQPQPAGMTT